MVEIKSKNQSIVLNRKGTSKKEKERVYYIGVFLYMVLPNR